MKRELKSYNIADAAPVISADTLHIRTLYLHFKWIKLQGSKVKRISTVLSVSHAPLPLTPLAAYAGCKNLPRIVFVHEFNSNIVKL